VSTPVTSPSPTPLQQAIRRLADGESLSFDEARGAFAALMAGEASPVQTAALLLGLRARGESADEVAGAAAALRDAMVRLPAANPDALVDTCGTGGGRVTTLNISTAAAFVVAAAGVPVAKHGNRSYTSRSGSADVLEALGVGVDLGPDAAQRALDAAGLTFLFAPVYHPAMRHVGPVRRELGVPTIMNLVGPLANPAGVRRQVVGVADRGRAPVVAAALARLGATHALVVHAESGMDELCPVGATQVWEVRAGDGVREWRLEAAAVGVQAESLDDLAGGDPAENAARIRLALEGRGPAAIREAIALNAAAALYVAGAAATLRAGVDLARGLMAAREATDVLERLRAAAPAPRR